MSCACDSMMAAREFAFAFAFCVGGGGGGGWGGRHTS